MGDVEKNSDCTVVVCSCNKYADLLGPFATLFRKFWPDCPFEAVLVTETAPQKGLSFDRVVACGDGTNWASRLVKALGEISTPYVLMLCDDYFLSGKVDTGLILKRLAEAKTLSAANLRMIPNPRPTAVNAKPFDRGSDLMRYRPHTAYSIATQAGLWDRRFLASIAEGKSSIWEFERYGSFDHHVTDETLLLVTQTQEFPFVDAVHKGYWEKAGIALCRANGIEPDLARRGLPPPRVRMIEGMKALVFNVVPTTLLVRFQNALGLGAKEKRRK